MKPNGGNKGGKNEDVRYSGPLDERDPPNERGEMDCADE